MISRLIETLRQRARIRAVAQLMGIRVVALAGNVLSGLLTAKFLGPSGRGELAALIVAPAIIGPICTLGLHASLIYNVRRDPENASRYFGTALLMLIGTGLAGMAASMLLIQYWLGNQYNADTIAFARLILLIVPLNVISPSFNAVLEANGKFGTSNSVIYVQSLVTLGLLGVLAWTGLMTPHAAALCYSGFAIPIFLYLSVQAWRILRPKWSFAAPFPQRLLRFGLRFYGVDILGVASSFLDQFIVVFFLQPSEVGNYAVALSLTRVLQVAQGAVSTVLFPSIAGRDVPSVVEMVGRAVRVTSMVNALGAIGLAVVGPYLLTLVYGTKFQPAVAPFLILLFEAILSSAARTLAQAFSASGRPSAVTAMEMAGVIGSVSAMMVLVPHLGTVGAAYGAAFGGAVRLTVALASFRKVLGVELPRLWLNRMDFSWVVAGRS